MILNDTAVVGSTTNGPVGFSPSLMDSCRNSRALPVPLEEYPPDGMLGCEVLAKWSELFRKIEN